MGRTGTRAREDWTLRLVIDTDVLVSGLRSMSGASRVLLMAAAKGIVVPVVSVAIVLEYEAVLKRTDIIAATGLTVAEVDAVVDELIRLGDHAVTAQPTLPRIQDPHDEKFVDAFLNGHADAIVTFNLRDYHHADQRLASQGTPAVEACTPGEILRRLSWRPSPNSPYDFPSR